MDEQHSNDRVAGAAAWLERIVVLLTLGQLLLPDGWFRRNLYETGERIAHAYRVYRWYARKVDTHPWTTATWIISALLWGILFGVALLCARSIVRWYVDRNASDSGNDRASVVLCLGFLSLYGWYVLAIPILGDYELLWNPRVLTLSHCFFAFSGLCISFVAHRFLRNNIGVALMAANLSMFIIALVFTDSHVRHFEKIIPVPGAVAMAFLSFKLCSTAAANRKKWLLTCQIYPSLLACRCLLPHEFHALATYFMILAVLKVALWILIFEQPRDPLPAKLKRERSDHSWPPAPPPGHSRRV